MIAGQGSTSLRKQDQENGRIQSVGYTKTKFATKAVAGDTGINLSSLTTPPEMSTNGFVNPPTSKLAGANLLFFRNNLKLTSSARGPLEDYIDYTVSSSMQINFVGFTAQENEIFVGVIDYNAQTGVAVANTTSAPVSATLAAGTTDVNLGRSFQTGKWSQANVGAVAVYKDRVLQFRNTGNSSTTLDGDYYEVDNGSGSFSIIRFNQAETGATTIDVIPNGWVIEQNNGSMISLLEAMQGQVQNVAAVVAALAGAPLATVLGAAPSNVDLTAFGNRVLTLEQTRAIINAANAWSAAQTFNSGLLGNTGVQINKQYVAGTTYTNGTPTLSCAQAGWTPVRGVFVPYQTYDGAWRLRFSATGTFTSASISSVTVGVSGITSKNVAGFNQAIIANWEGPGTPTGYAQAYAWAGNLIFYSTAAYAATGVMFAGDIELDSKPTWAD